MAFQESNFDVQVKDWFEANLKLNLTSSMKPYNNRAITILLPLVAQSIFVFFFAILTFTITPVFGAEADVHQDFEDDSLILERQWHQLGRGIGNDNLGNLAGYAVTTSASGYTVTVASPLHTSLTESNPPKHAGRVRVYRYDFGCNGWAKVGQYMSGD